MALLLLMCLRGNVFVYQGEELGLPQAEVPFERLVDPEAIANWPQTLGRDGARTPIPWVALRRPTPASPTVEPWLPVDPRHLKMAVDAQEADPDLDPARRAPSSSPCVTPIRRCATGGLDLIESRRCAGLPNGSSGPRAASVCCACSTWATSLSTGPRPPARAGSRRSTGPRPTDRGWRRWPA